MDDVDGVDGVDRVDAVRLYSSCGYLVVKLHHHLAEEFAVVARAEAIGADEGAQAEFAPGFKIGVQLFGGFSKEVSARDAGGGADGLIEDHPQAADGITHGTRRNIFGIVPNLFADFIGSDGRSAAAMIHQDSQDARFDGEHDSDVGTRR